MVDEGGFSGIMVVEFYDAATVRADDGTWGNVFSPGSFDLLEGTSTEYSEFFIIRIRPSMPNLFFRASCFFLRLFRLLIHRF